MSSSVSYQFDKHYLTQDWGNLHMTCQVIAQAVKEITTDLSRDRSGKPDRQLYIHHIDRLSRNGYGFKTASDGIYYTSCGNFYKCEALIEVIDNLSPYITICRNKDLMMGDSPMPAAKLKCGLSDRQPTHHMLLICDKAMEVLNRYKNEEETRMNRIDAEKKKKQLQEQENNCSMQ